MGTRFPDFYNTSGTPWGPIPGTADPEFRVLNTTGSPAAIHTAGAVKVSVVAGAYNTVKADWPAVSGAVSYSVYAGFSPLVQHAVLKTTTTALTYTFQFFPSVPTDLITQVWVKATFGNATTSWIQAEAATVENSTDYLARSNNPLEPSYSRLSVDNDYMRFVIAEVRRRAVVMIQNDGEEFVIYPIRRSGAYCNCNQQYGNVVSGTDAIQGNVNSSDVGIGKEPDVSADSQNDALHQCPRCFGTGIKGGYYSGMPVLMRYGNIPPRHVFYKGFAMDLEHNYNSWSLGDPRLHQHDIVRRVKTGEMFVCGEPARAEVRGVVTHQECKLDLLPPGDARYLVTDASIAAGEAS